MDRNYLSGTEGDVSNAVLAAAGYNSLLIASLELYLREILRRAIVLIPQTQKLPSA
jgi:hypothetical protein